MDELGIIVFLDFPRDFDTVSHKSLLRKINNQGDYQPFYMHTQALTHAHLHKKKQQENSYNGDLLLRMKRCNCRVTKDHFKTVRGNPLYSTNFVLPFMVPKFILNKLDFHSESKPQIN